MNIYSKRKYATHLKTMRTISLSLQEYQFIHLIHGIVHLHMQIRIAFSNRQIHRTNVEQTFKTYSNCVCFTCVFEWIFIKQLFEFIFNVQYRTLSLSLTLSLSIAAQ